MSANLIGSRVGQARKAKGLSQKEVADRAGLSRQSVMAVEAGRGSLASLARIAAAIEFKLSGIARGGTLPEQLKARRAGLGWSVAKLSKMSALAPATIRNLEQGVGHVESAELVLQHLSPAARLRSPPRAHWSP